MIIKFCGLTRQEDADAAARMGAQMCGFIFHEESPRRITPEQADAIDSGPMKRVGVFVHQSMEDIRRIMDKARLDYAQLHGWQDAACAKALGPERVIRVLWPDRYPHRALLHADLWRHADACAFFLLDSGIRDGGSGQRLEWEDLSNLRPPHPWLLAGGLDASNVAEAVRLCNPDGVDFNSGAEDAPGLKNADKMKAAVAAATSTSNR